MTVVPCADLARGRRFLFAQEEGGECTRIVAPKLHKQYVTKNAKLAYVCFSVNVVEKADYYIIYPLFQSL
ncbi:hypothetical protein ATO00_01480 [Loigolactobacillus coryniformis subsp. coryniformis]|nr:hypothetical protein LC20001_04005 [Loigolactobacillus coryniformis subsp. coryniformis KCTC 3167 = DSM 20001]OEH90880.1 hypothetical protein ATO00_01480 [Loigolactobacillus coryniformis subsp. coryniformis]RRG05497.1 MAG: hypothetical protein DUD28_05945 [Lactobacillus sp.]